MGFVTIYFCDKVELLTQCVEYLEHDISLFFVACEILFGGILHQKSLGPGRKQGHQSLLFLVQNNKSAKTKVEQRTETRGGVFSLQEEKLCQTLSVFPIPLQQYYFYALLLSVFNNCSSSALYYASCVLSQELREPKTLSDMPLHTVFSRQTLETLPACILMLVSLARWRFQLAPFVSKQSNKDRHLAVKINL